MKLIKRKKQRTNILSFSPAFKLEHNMSGFCNNNVSERPEHDWVFDEALRDNKCTIECKHCGLLKIIMIEELIQENCIDDELKVELIMHKIYLGELNNGNSFTIKNN